jgi:hypothetical protein
VRVFIKISSESWVNNSAVFLQLFWVLLTSSLLVVAFQRSLSNKQEKNKDHDLYPGNKERLTNNEQIPGYIVVQCQRMAR